MRPRFAQEIISTFELLAFAQVQLWAELRGFAQSPPVLRGRRRRKEGPMCVLYRMGSGPFTPSLPAAKCEALAFFLSVVWHPLISSFSRTYRMFYPVATSGDLKDFHSRPFIRLPVLGLQIARAPLPRRGLDRRMSLSAVELLAPDNQTWAPVLLSLPFYVPQLASV